jgi:arylsulfatase A-like enzyme
VWGGLRLAGGAVAATAALAATAAYPGSVPVRSSDPRPNVIVILTDDQSFDTLPADPPAMPWLQGRLDDPSGHWRWFPNAYVETPLCCPSRATLLTGRWSRTTGVLDNRRGHLLDEQATIAVRLHEAGYRTALIGKYLNGYPFGRGPYVPPGWDRWVAKGNVAEATTYYGYPYIDQGVPLTAGRAPASYATDLLAGDAVDFVRTAPSGRPYFLLFAPSAPHAPQTPPDRYAAAFDDVELPRPPSFGVVHPRAPEWIRSLPPIDPAAAAALDAARLRERRALLAVDDAVEAIVRTVAERGDLGRTVIFFLTDNGVAFGEHRWTAKSCPYVECVRTPFAVHAPDVPAGTDPTLVSNVDLAPTIASLAGLAPVATDGVDIAPLLTGDGPPPSRPVVLSQYHGGARVPPWISVRTRHLAYIRTGDTEELYDLGGRYGPPDPYEIDDRADDPRYADVRSELATMLRSLAAPPSEDG